jgi:hypothetical protein
VLQRAGVRRAQERHHRLEPLTRADEGVDAATFTRGSEDTAGGDAAARRLEVVLPVRADARAVPVADQRTES